MNCKSISNLSNRGVALTILSKLLLGVGDKKAVAEELKTLYDGLFKLTDLDTRSCLASADSADTFSLDEIPWEKILDAMVADSHTMRGYVESGQFPQKELRYMCALMCGLSGKEYGLITGFKSQYNLSWSIRQKLGIPAKSTNLRNFLQNLPKKAAI